MSKGYFLRVDVSEGTSRLHELKRNWRTLLAWKKHLPNGQDLKKKKRLIMENYFIDLLRKIRELGGGGARLSSHHLEGKSSRVCESGVSLVYTAWSTQNR